jgi:hypothetical protein
MTSPLHLPKPTPIDQQIIVPRRPDPLLISYETFGAVPLAVWTGIIIVLSGPVDPALFRDHTIT